MYYSKLLCWTEISSNPYFWLDFPYPTVKLDHPLD